MYPNIRTHLIARVQNLSIKDRNNSDTKLFLKKFPLIAYLQQLKYVLFLKRILLPVTIYIYIISLRLADVDGDLAAHEPYASQI